MTELDGTPVRDAADLQLRLALLRIGEVAEFAVSRPGGAVTRLDLGRSRCSASSIPLRMSRSLGESLRQHP